MQNQIRRIFKALTFAAVIGYSGILPAQAEVPESKDPIKIAMFDWTSQVLNSRIIGGIYEKLGYKVEYVTADYLASIATGLRTGDLTLGMEYWDTTGIEAMREADASGQTENLGKLGPKSKEEWWYPSYMKEQCPGLPDWKALNDCAELFSTAETAPKGRYLSAPATWGGFDEERVAALGLNYEVVHAGTDGFMWSELTSAYQRKAPILMWIYMPHWVPQKYEGEWVAFPEYTEACYTDPAWGVNPNATHDCGKPHGEIWKYSWIGMKDKWPTAHRIAKNFTIGTEELQDMIAMVDLEGKAIDAVAAEWVAANESRWREWVK